MNVSVKPPVALKKKRLSGLQLQQPNFKLGFYGETQARTWLIRAGWQILEQNLRLKNHEIDILAIDPETTELVVVEVKTRSSQQFGEAALAVDNRKLKSLHQVVSAYCQRRHLENDVRFDIICVLPSGIQHFKNVSW